MRLPPSLIASQLVALLSLVIATTGAVPVEWHDDFWRPLAPFAGFTPVVRVTRQFRAPDSFIPVGSSIPLQNEKPRASRPVRHRELDHARAIEAIRALERQEPRPIQEARSSADIMFPVTKVTTRPLPEPSKRPLPASLTPNDSPKPSARHEGPAVREEPERTSRALEASPRPSSSDDAGFPAIASTQDNWNYDVNWAEFGRRRRRAAPAERKDQPQRKTTPDNLAVESRRPAAETRVPAPTNRRPESRPDTRSAPQSKSEARSAPSPRPEGRSVPPPRPEARSAPPPRRPVQIGAAERRERERERARPAPQKIPERRQSRPEARPQRPESRRPPQSNRTPERREREGSAEARRQKPGNHKDDKQEYDGPYIYTQLFGPPYEVGYIRSPVPSKHVYEDYLQFVRSWSSASRDAVDDMVRKNPALADQYKDAKYQQQSANKDYKDDGYSNSGKDSAYKDDGYDSKPAYKDESYDSKPAYKDESYDSKPSSTYKDDPYDSKPDYKDDPYSSAKPATTYKDDPYDSKPAYKDESYDSKPGYKDESYDSKNDYKDDPYSSTKPSTTYKDDPYDSKPAYKDESYDSKPAYKDESYDSKPAKNDYKDDGYQSTANYHSPAPGYKAPEGEFLPGSKPYQSGSSGGYDDNQNYDILKPFQKGKPADGYSSGSSYDSAKPSYDSNSYDSGYDAGKKYDAPTRPGTASSSYYETPTRYVEPPPYSNKDSYKSDSYKSDSYKSDGYDAPTATYIPPSKSKNDYDDKDYKDSSYGGDGYSSGGNKYDVDTSSSYQKVEQGYDSKESYGSSGSYDAKPDDSYSAGSKDAYADSYDDKSKPADYSSSTTGKKKHYPVIIGRYQVTDSTAFLPKKVGGDAKGASYSTGSGGAVGSHVHGANGEEYVVYYLPYGQPLPVPVRRRRSADPGIVGYRSLADRPVEKQRIRARNLEVLTPAEVQELLKNPAAYTEASKDEAKSDAPQVTVEETVVGEEPVSLVSLTGLDEHAVNLAAELSDLPTVDDSTDDSIAQVDTPADESHSKDEAHEEAVTSTIAQEEAAVTDSPTIVKDAPVKEEQEKLSEEPHVEHAVGEIIIVADVEVPEDGEAPLPAVEGDVSVLEFLSEANAAGQLKPIDVEMHEQHPAWVDNKKKNAKKPAIESISTVPGLTQKPVEYVKPPGIAEKDAKNWNGYSTWWTKLGNRVAKLYNYE